MSVLINALLKEGLITEEQLTDARSRQAGAKKPMQDVLVEMGFINEGDLIKISSSVFNMPVTNLETEEIDRAVVSLLSYEQAKRYGVFPLRKDAGALVLATSDPQDILALDDIKLLVNMPVKPVLGTKTQISNSIMKYYDVDDYLYDLLKNVEGESDIGIVRKHEDDLEFSGQDTAKGELTPVVKLVSLILGDAVRAKASDIHIEPQEDTVDVRYRIDGDLKNIMKIPSRLSAQIISRIKVMAELDIAESKKSQDGRFKILFENRKIDVRVSLVPTYHGEKAVLRLLDPKEAKIEIGKIGFQETELAVFKEAITKHQGIVLITGPTGSGKTSTLYAALNFIKSETKNIVTIEDPVEYLIEGVNQIQVNPVKEVTFAGTLKNILRQDPNVILVGEIRDRETADIAFRSSLTGHLVFSTLHTNSAASSVTRLLDIGLEPYLIASSLILIASQRLVRLICDNCRQEYAPEKELVEKVQRSTVNFAIEKFYRGKGCARCNFTGFSGRGAIFEILTITDKVRGLIAGKAAENLIVEEAKGSGYQTLLESGLRKVAAGLTTLEEMAKVVDITVKDDSAEKAAPPSAFPTILIAEDEDDIAFVLEKRLAGAGFNVVRAKNGREALECVFRKVPDLVVMDMSMPEMGGIEATRILRSRLATATIPVMMLTANKDKDSELAGLDAGADDYLTKPFDKDKLLARIKMLLRRRER